MNISGDPVRGDRVRVVCLIDTIGAHAGTENQLVEVLRRLDRQVIEMHLCCLEDSERLREIARLCPVVVFPTRRIYTPGGLWQMLRFRKYLDRERIQVLHTLMTRATMFGVLAARHSGCKAVITARRNLGYWYTPGYKYMFRYLNRHTTRVLANSEGAKRAAVEVEGIPADKVDVIYNGVDTEAYSVSRARSHAADASGIPHDARVVGIVANLRPVKDLPLFLRAASVVASRIPDARFLIAGHGPMREELGRLASELGIASRVYFTDGKGRVVDYLHRMSIACLTSASEGFSNAILEYMAAGLPVVATNVGGNSEAIVDGETGILVSERTPEAFAAPLLMLLNNEILRRSMGAAGLARCRELFEIERIVRLQESYYLKLTTPLQSTPGLSK